ncbi:MAG: hypothetical protein ACJ8A6_16230 [Gemmatimonadales bacterium]
MSVGLGLGMYLVLAAAGQDQSIPYHAASLPAGVPGYFSRNGLPPVRGVLTLTADGLSFRSPGGSVLLSYPTIQSNDRMSRRPAPRARLAYTGKLGSRVSYVFRINDGIFETADPGGLPSLLTQLVLDPLPSNPVHGIATPATAAGVIRQLSHSAYADTLYDLFGKPARPVGLVGPRGIRLGDLAEYIRPRDSVALDPVHIISQDQLRHAFAHELGHRWEQREMARVDSILGNVLAMGDPERYGYGSRAEHRAEAIAFAVHFLQSTMTEGSSDQLDLLEHYEFLVPGTRAMVRYLILLSAYRHHPFRASLTGQQDSSPLVQ